MSIVPNPIVPISYSPNSYVPIDQKPELQMPKYRKLEYKTCPRPRILPLLGGGEVLTKGVYLRGSPKGRPYLTRVLAQRFKVGFGGGSLPIASQKYAHIRSHRDEHRPRL